MKIRDWLIHLPTDAIRNAMNAHRDAYNDVKYTYVAGGYTGDTESMARHKADLAFIHSLISILPVQER